LPLLDTPYNGATEGITMTDLNKIITLRNDLSRIRDLEFHFDSVTRALYASEASNYRQTPLAVVIPKTLEAVVSVLRVCHQQQVPILPRGAGTSMCGQSVNAAVTIDFSRYLHVVEVVDPEARIARVQPGVICDQLKKDAARYELTFGPDPATHSRCTLGGMIGNNACGAHSVMAGKTAENTERLEIATSDGERFWVGPTDESAFAEHLAAGGRRAEIVRALKKLVDHYGEAIRDGFPGIARRVSGYNLDQLLPENGFNIGKALVGTEGTCVTILRADVKLITNPGKRRLAVLGFQDIFEAADAVPALLTLRPIAMEGLDYGIIGGLIERNLRLDDIALLPEGRAWLMIEFAEPDVRDSSQLKSSITAALAQQAQRVSTLILESGEMMQRLWSIRETGASATSLSQDPEYPDPTVGWEDAAVEPARLGSYLREFNTLVARYGYKTNLYGHFGDGCVHSRITFDMRTEKGIADWRQFLEEAAKLVVKYGGSISGEHGDGQAKGEFLPLMYGDSLIGAFREFKKIWDPKGLMNPGKLIDAMSVDTNLRLGPSYRRRAQKTEFTYGKMGALGYAREMERCIGMGKCRSMEGGVMCPSFKATREERYSTRGRARLFHELLNGELVAGSEDEESIKESLEMCLSCKGCKHDCPTHVDIAKYKSEFLARYHRSHRRSIFEWSVASIASWLPVANRLSVVLNTIATRNWFRRLAGKAGLRLNVRLPVLPGQTFRRSETAKRLRGTLRSALTARHVVLWIDTFNNGFTPSVLEAAVRVIRSTGCIPVVSSRSLCCGRPLYDAGLLPQAREAIKAILDDFALVLQSEASILVLEPSCLSVFRDEAKSLLADDSRVETLASKVVTMAEFAVREGIELGSGTFVAHAHCHQKACGGTEAEVQLGMRLLNSGCCGMAGAFGYRTQTETVAKKVAEMEFAPVLASLPVGTNLVADGFSCRSQVKNVGAADGRHLAEFLAERLHSTPKK
jgi:FAD/FMN-containing dehydrogenase/Fe-S oxidoreductase